MARLTQEEFFAKVPHWLVIDPDVSPSAMKVYVVLSMRAHNTTRLAFPGIRRIAADSHLSTSTVTRAIAQLEMLGAVLTTRQRVDGVHQVNQYHLPMLPFGGVVNSDTPPVAKIATSRRGSEHTPVSESATKLDESELDERTRELEKSKPEIPPQLPGESRAAHFKRTRKT